MKMTFNNKIMLVRYNIEKCVGSDSRRSIIIFVANIVHFLNEMDQPVFSIFLTSSKNKTQGAPEIIQILSKIQHQGHRYYSTSEKNKMLGILEILLPLSDKKKKPPGAPEILSAFTKNMITESMYYFLQK